MSFTACRDLCILCSSITNEDSSRWGGKRGSGDSLEKNNIYSSCLCHLIREWNLDLIGPCTHHRHRRRRHRLCLIVQRVSGRETLLGWGLVENTITWTYASKKTGLCLFSINAEKNHFFIRKIFLLSSDQSYKLEWKSGVAAQTGFFLFSDRLDLKNQSTPPLTETKQTQKD